MRSEIAHFARHQSGAGRHHDRRQKRHQSRQQEVLETVKEFQDCPSPKCEQWGSCEECGIYGFDNEEDPLENHCPACGNGVPGQDSLCEKHWEEYLGTHVGGRDDS